MKRIKLFFAFTLATIFTSGAVDFNIDGLQYSALDGTDKATLRQHWIVNSQGWNVVKPYVGDIVIPDRVTYKGVTYTVTEIYQAFSDCPDLTSVTIPATVTKISALSFQKLPSLKWVRLEAGEQPIEIEYKNFGCSTFAANFTSLERFDVGRPIETTSSPFKDLPALKEIRILAGCPNLDVSDIYYSQVERLIIEDSSSPLTLTNVSGGPSKTLKHLYLGRNISQEMFNRSPLLATVEIGDNVTSITDYAFSSCKSLTNVTIGSGLNSFGASCFAYCDKLVAVKSKSNPATIGESAFYNCTSLTSFDFGNALKTLGKSSFYGCSSLSGFAVGESITSIGSTAFRGCALLTDFTIPSSTALIGSNAFMSTGLRNLTIADGDTQIVFESKIENTVKNLYLGREAVDQNGSLLTLSYSNIETATFGPKVSRLPNKMLQNCTELRSVGLLGYVASIPNEFCDGCTSLENVTFANDMVEIGYYAFANCTNLTAPALGNSLKTIGRGAFHGCLNLGEMVIPGSVELIAEDPFYGAVIAKLTFEKGETPLTASSLGNQMSCGSLFIDRLISGKADFCSNKTAAKVVFGDNVESVSDGLFTNAKLTGVSLGKNIRTIGESAFADASGLTEVEIPGNVVTLGYECFRNCRDLESVSFSEGLKTIEASAFWNCAKLVEIVLPASVEKVNDRAFACGSLQSVTLLDSDSPLIVYGGLYKEAFKNDAIKKLYIGRDFNSFETPFASYSRSVTEIEFGASVTRIAEDAYNFNALETIKSASSTPPAAFDSSVNDKAYSSATLIVRKSAADDYATAPMWRKFLNRQFVVENVYNVAIEISGEGKALLNGEEVSNMEIDECDPLRIEVIPAENHKLELLAVNGSNVTAEAASGCYTIEKVSSDIDIQVVFSEDEMDAVAEISTSAIKPRGSVGAIEINGADGITPAFVYDMNGRLIYSGTDSRIETAAGVYLVKSAGETFKVIVL